MGIKESAVENSGVGSAGKGRGAVLVSGAGSGIGRAMASSFANEGATLVLVGRRRDALEETREMLPEPSRHVVVTADVRDASALREGFAGANFDDGSGHRRK